MSHTFSLLSVLQMGKNYEWNTDGYVYVYSPNGNLDGTMNQLVIAVLKVALAAFVAVKLVFVAVTGLFVGALLRRLYRARAAKRGRRTVTITRQRKRMRTASVVD